MDKLIIVSADAHAEMPTERWPDYVEKRYHHLFPGLFEDNKRWTEITGVFRQYSPEVLETFDKDYAFRSGHHQGVWNANVRLAEMDREGIAAEVVYMGDSRAISLFHYSANRPYEPDVCQAGARGFHRWLVDTFGAASDRLLLTGVAGPCVDMDDTTAELSWIADHSFRGVFAPQFTRRNDVPPLYDPYWDPFWTVCEERGLTVVIHAGYGLEQGMLLAAFDAIYERMVAAGRSDLVSEIFNHNPEFFAIDFKPRQAMWQIMMGGVFDRHPKLKLMMSEVRGDWLPATLQHLDTVFEEHRADLPAKRKPSEYWQTNCLVSLSFVKRAEVDMRHEIGLDTIMFGRDYPHAEGTWPNTKDWLCDAFGQVPEPELRQILGENAIAGLGLERPKLAAIADKIGPTIADITGNTTTVDPKLIEHFDFRAGYLKPAEQVDIATLDEDLATDLAGLTPATP